MLALRNQTPFKVAIFPGLDKDGYDTATVLVKGTFALNRRDQPLALADEQVDVVHGDVFRGEPSTSSVVVPSDVSPLKRGTDVLLEGHAYPADRSATSVDVTLAVGRIKKTARVFGNRAWYRGAGRWQISAPARVQRTPLVYESAFGGADLSDADPAAHVWDERNPVGTGFTTGKNDAHLEGLRLPNLEDPDDLIDRPTARPRPISFGAVGRPWMPRRAFGGTFDDRWKAERFPLLPLDFDERFFNAAAADQIHPDRLRGGEPVTITNASELGPVRFTVPERSLELEASLKGEPLPLAPALDTLLIEPDAQRAILSWRATFRCPRSFLYIDYVRVREARPS